VGEFLVAISGGIEVAIRGLHPAEHLSRPGFDFLNIGVQRFHPGKTGVLEPEFQGFFPDYFFQTHTAFIYLSFYNFI